ncbi:Rv3235 family protein [Plantibacter sp. Mn2098]|uniref:Rv3235 family protein n=1 Tax=Plantibacter sp. Mn2098 TaxID=3395266 RepID=UPI003BCF6413
MSIALPDDDAAASRRRDHHLPHPVDPAPSDRFIADDFFGQQPVSTAKLPDPKPLLVNLTRSVIEVIAGARDLAQLARWITADVHTVLLKRAILAERARRVRGLPTARPVVQIGTVTVSEPRDGVIEAVVMVHTKTRSRAVAIRLEGLDRRWRATSISVL